MTANSDLIIYQENGLYGLKDYNGMSLFHPSIRRCFHSVAA